VIRLVEADGWRLKIVRGSHRQFKHPLKPGKVTVSGRQGQMCLKGTLHAILKQAGLSKPMKYLVLYERGPTSWGAYIPDLPGCVSVGDTLEEVKQLIREAVEIHLEGMREDGDPIPEPTTLCEYTEVAAPVFNQPR